MLWLRAMSPDHTPGDVSATLFRKSPKYSSSTSAPTKEKEIVKMKINDTITTKVVIEEPRRGFVTFRGAGIRSFLGLVSGNVSCLEAAPISKGER